MSSQMRDPVEADLVAHVATLYGPPVGQVHRDERCIWFVTGDDSPSYNGILKAALDPNDLASSIEELLGPFDRLRVPMMWWFFTGPEGLSRDVEQALDEAGCELESNRPSMALPLGSFEPDEGSPSLDVERVSDPVAFEEWGKVVGRAFGAEDYSSSLSSRAFRRIGWEDTAPFRHYMCRREGIPVGAATLSLAGGVAGLANIATLPEHRREGIARATTTALLLDARALGMSTAALSSDETGEHLYRSLGFVEIGRHLTFVRRI